MVENDENKSSGGIPFCSSFAIFDDGAYTWLSNTLPLLLSVFGLYGNLVLLILLCFFYYTKRHSTWLKLNNFQELFFHGMLLLVCHDLLVNGFAFVLIMFGGFKPLATSMNEAALNADFLLGYRIFFYSGIYHCILVCVVLLEQLAADLNRSKFNVQSLYMFSLMAFGCAVLNSTKFILQTPKACADADLNLLYTVHDAEQAQFWHLYFIIEHYALDYLLPFALIIYYAKLFLRTYNDDSSVFHLFVSFYRENKPELQLSGFMSNIWRRKTSFHALLALCCHYIIVFAIGIVSLLSVPALTWIGLITADSYVFIAIAFQNVVLFSRFSSFWLIYLLSCDHVWFYARCIYRYYCLVSDTTGNAISNAPKKLPLPPNNEKK